MADEGREDTRQQAPPVDQPTEDSPAVSFEPDPQVVDSTAVEEPVEQQQAPPSPPEPRPEASSDGRPELEVLGAFAGAFLFAQILKRLGGGHE